MPNFNCTSFQQNYVYMPEGSDEYRTIFVDLRLIDDTPTFKIFTEANIAKEDLERILKDFQSNQFFKMKMSIPKECAVILSVDDELFNVTFTGNGCEVMDIVPQS